MPLNALCAPESDTTIVYMIVYILPNFSSNSIHDCVY